MTSVLLATVLLGATGQIHESFVVNAPATHVVAWLAANPDKAIQSTDARLLWKQGSRVCVQKETPRGTIWLVMNQTVVGTRYDCSLVQGSPQVRGYSLHGVLSPVGLTQTRIDVWVSCSINMPLATPAVIEKNLRKGVSQFRNTINQSVR